jgi:hypothetical protein
MAYKLMFFVQAVGINKKGRLECGHPFEVASEEEAKAKAFRLSEKNIGVVAFSQMVDKAAGDCEEPTILAHYGRVPAEMRSEDAA